MTGSHDKYLILAETDGTVLRTWPSAHIHDLAISSDGRLLFSVTSEKKVGCLLPIFSEVHASDAMNACVRLAGCEVKSVQHLWCGRSCTSKCNMSANSVLVDEDPALLPHVFC